MERPLAAPDGPAIDVPDDIGRDDRVAALAAPIPTFSTALLLLAIGSLAVHAVLVTTAVVTSRSAGAAVPREIAVEIIHEPEPAREKAARKAEPPKPPAAAADPSPMKPAAQEKVDLKPQSAKLEPSGRPTPEPKPLPPAPQRSAPARDVDALQKELADLKAEQAALEARADSARNEARQGSSGQNAGARNAGLQSAGLQNEGAQGPLAGSQHAIALPGAGENGEDAVAYQDLVFSQLAKAKGFGEYHGAAGTTGVRFAIDDTGRLLSADVAVSSGNGQLDADALAIVRRAGPFPPPPKDSDRSFVANVNFVPPKQP